MFRKKEKSNHNLLPKLVTSLTEASEIILVQIEKGRRIFEQRIVSVVQLHSLESKYNSWNNENFVILKRIFDVEAIAKDYSISSWSIGNMLISDLLFVEKVNNLKQNLENKINKLESVYASLELFEDVKRENQIYFVHSKDTDATQKVIDYLKSEGYSLVILKKVSGAGTTIIDDIESNLDIRYAVVVLNPDGVDANYPNQNILLELGIFIGHLGRENVSAICEPNTILPLDYHGFEYIDFSGNWEKKLKHELKGH